MGELIQVVPLLACLGAGVDDTGEIGIDADVEAAVG